MVNFLRSKAVFQIILVVTMSFFISNVFAQTEEISTEDSCCGAAKNGETCVTGISQEDCSEGFVGFGSCSAINACVSSGCCVTPDGCYDGSSQVACSLIDSSEFYDATYCSNFDVCVPKCCVMDTQCALLGEEECAFNNGEIRSDILLESECVNVCEKMDTGCCVSEDSCIFGALENCEGEIFSNLMCSQVEKCSKFCTSHAYQDCGGPNNEDVYWYDSCGNLEDVSADCDSTGESGSTSGCGDPDADLRGDSCISWDCVNVWDSLIVDENGDGDLVDVITRKHGESWCEYQAAVGPTLDLPGSTHYRHYCLKGQEMVEQCSSDRSRICMYGELKFSPTTSMSLGSCVENLWEGCSDAETKLDCEDPSKMCVWLGGSEEETVASTFEVSFGYDSFSKELLISGGKYLDESVTDDQIYIKDGDNVVKSISVSSMTSTDHDTYVEYTTTFSDLPPGKYSTVLVDVTSNKEYIMSENFDTTSPTAVESGYCVPLVAPGTVSVSSDDEGESEDTCSVGTISMTGVAFWEEECVGTEWRCSKGCEVYDFETKKGMNSLCNAYGDCGAKYNLAQEFSNLGFERNCGDGTYINYECNGDDYDAWKGWIDERNDKDFGNSGNNLEDVQDFLYEENINFEDYSIAGAGLDLLGLTDFSTYPDSTHRHEEIAAVILGSIAGAAAIEGAILGGIMGFTVATVIVKGTVGGWGAILGGLSGGFSALGPIGLGLGVALMTLLVIFAAVLARCTDEEKRDVEFQCSNWEVPQGGADCYKCHTKQSEMGLLPDPFVTNLYGSKELFDSLQGLQDTDLESSLANIEDLMVEKPGYECTPQLCVSLGKSCEFFQTVNGPACVEVLSSDVNSPVLEVKEVSYECNKAAPDSVGGCDYSSNSENLQLNGFIDDVNNSLKIVLKTKDSASGLDDIARCKLSDLQSATYDTMDSGFLEGDQLSIEHTLYYDALKQGQEFNYYVRCQDASPNANTNDRSFTINFKVANQPDMTPPTVTGFSPEPGQNYVKFGDIDTEITVYVNEETLLGNQGGCRWSKFPQVPFDQMDNYLSCGSGGLVHATECNGILKDVQLGQNDYYIKCSDREGNNNTQDWPNGIDFGGFNSYVVYGTENLTIGSVDCFQGDGLSCGEKIYGDNFTLKVSTFGGGDTGKSICKYNLNDIGWVAFVNTNLSESNQPFGPGLLEGMYNFGIKCEDFVGNLDQKELSVEVYVDREKPLIERVYLEGYKLVVETSEDSRCSYDLNESYLNPVEFTNTGFDYHSVDYTGSDYYVIGCEDLFGNRMDRLSVEL